MPDPNDDTEQITDQLDRAAEAEAFAARKESEFQDLATSLLGPRRAPTYHPPGPHLPAAPAVPGEGDARRHRQRDPAVRHPRGRVDRPERHRPGLALGLRPLVAVIGLARWIATRLRNLTVAAAAAPLTVPAFPLRCQHCTEAIRYTGHPTGGFVDQSGHVHCEGAPVPHRPMPSVL